MLFETLHNCSAQLAGAQLQKRLVPRTSSNGNWGGTHRAVQSLRHPLVHSLQKA